MCTPVHHVSFCRTKPQGYKGFFLTQNHRKLLIETTSLGGKSWWDMSLNSPHFTLLFVNVPMAATPAPCSIGFNSKADKYSPYITQFRLWIGFKCGLCHSKAFNVVVNPFFAALLLLYLWDCCPVTNTIFSLLLVIHCWLQPMFLKGVWRSLSLTQP